MLCRQCTQLAWSFKELVRSLQVLHSIPHRSFATDTNAGDSSAPSSSDSSPGVSEADFYRKVAALQRDQSRSSATAWLTTADKAQHQADNSAQPRHSHRDAGPSTQSSTSDGAKGSNGLVHPEYGYAVLGGVDPATSLHVAGAQQPRLHPKTNYHVGDTYNPSDLSHLSSEHDEPWLPRRRTRAPEQLLALSEIKEELDYKNIDFLLNFVSTSGRIKTRRRTRLPPKLQSRVSRTIKLARQMALIPYETRVGDGGDGDTWRRQRAFTKAKKL